MKAPTDARRQREAADIHSIDVRFMIVLFFRSIESFSIVQRPAFSGGGCDDEIEGSNRGFEVLE